MHSGKDLLQQFYPQLLSAFVDLVYTKLCNTLLEALYANDGGVEMTPEGVAGPIF